MKRSIIILLILLLLFISACEKAIVSGNISGRLSTINDPEQELIKDVEKIIINNDSGQFSITPEQNMTSPPELYRSGHIHENGQLHCPRETWHSSGAAWQTKKWMILYLINRETGGIFTGTAMIVP